MMRKYAQYVQILPPPPLGKTRIKMGREANPPISPAKWLAKGRKPLPTQRMEGAITPCVTSEEAWDRFLCSRLLGSCFLLLVQSWWERVKPRIQNPPASNYCISKTKPTKMTIFCFAMEKKTRNCLRSHAHSPLDGLNLRSKTRTVFVARASGARDRYMALNLTLGMSSKVAAVFSERTHRQLPFEISCKEQHAHVPSLHLGISVTG